MNTLMKKSNIIIHKGVTYSDLVDLNPGKIE